MGMFDNYQNLTSDTPKSENVKCNEFSSSNPFETENGYSWKYGDTLNLEFVIESEAIYKGNKKFVPAEDFMKGLKPTAIMSIYNFRRECIYTLTQDNVDTTTVVFPIDEELSNKLVPSVYYCSLTLVDEVTGYKETIFGTNDCTLTVE